MFEVTINCGFATAVEPTSRVCAVAEMFGLGLDRCRRLQLYRDLHLEIRSSQVVLVTGSSGSGKSVLMRLLMQRARQLGLSYVDLAEVDCRDQKPLVDCFDMSLSQTLQILSLAGLSDAFVVLRRPGELSDGQRYRFRLAQAMARRSALIFADEFCATLDRLTAAVIAHNVRKFVDKFGCAFVAATSHDDLIEDLAPDVLVIKHLGGRTDVHYLRAERQGDEQS